MFKTVDTICDYCGAEREDVLVSAVNMDDGTQVVEAVMCECGRQMTLRVGGPRPIFAPGFFSHDGNPRRLEVQYTDADGKVHRHNIKDKIDPNPKGGAY